MKTQKKTLLLLLIILTGFNLLSQNVELSVQTGHTSTITNVVFSHDGQLLASADLNNKINIWHVSTGGQMKEFFFPKENGNIFKMEFSPDNNYLVMLTKLNFLMVWDISNSTFIYTTTLKIPVRTFCFGSQSNMIFVGADRIMSKYFDSSAPNTFVDTSFYDIQYDQEKKQLIVFTKSGSVLMVSEGGKIENVVSNPEVNRIFQNRFFYGSKFIYDKTSQQIVFSRLHRIIVKDISANKNAFAFSSDYIDEIFNSFAISEKNNIVIGANGDGKLYVADLTRGKIIKKLKGHLSDAFDIAFNPEENLFASCSKDRSILIWDTKTMKIIKRLYSRAFPITTMTKSNDESLIIFGNETGFVRTINIESVLLQMNSIRPHRNLISDIEMLPGDSFLISCGYDNQLCLMKCEPLEQVKSKDFKKLPRIDVSIFRFLQHLGFYVEPYIMADSLDIFPEKQMVSVWGNSRQKRFFIKHKLEGDSKYYKYPVYKKSYNFQLKKVKNHAGAVTKVNDLETLTNYFDIYNPVYGHKEKVTDKIELIKHRLVATSSMDATIKLWNTVTGQLVLTIIPIDRDKKVLITAENYYLAPKDALSAIGFKVGSQYFPTEQFDLQYNRPDLVHDKLGIASPELLQAFKAAYLKRLKKMGYSENDISQDLHLPQAIILNKAEIPLIIVEPYIEFRLKAIDEKYKLSHLKVFINDVPVYGAAGMDISSMNENILEKNIRLELANGKNKIQVSVLNEKGAESLKETFEVYFRTEMEKPDLFLVCIGTSEYNDKRFNLNYASKDARDIMDIFSDSKGLFDSIFTRFLINEQVIKENILELKSFLMTADRNDIVIIFIAGHGLLDENFNYYYGTYDIDFNKPALRGISYDELGALLDGLKALKKLLFMDTCHSGEVDKDEVEVTHEVPVQSGSISFRAAGIGIRTKEGFGLKNTNELAKVMFSDLRTGTGSTVISSSGGAEYSMESKNWQNGLFTYCLLEGLSTKKADLNHDNKIMVSELQNYIRQRADLLSGGQQQPTSRSENVSMDFRIW